MSINLSATVQHSLGFPALLKIDPNTQKLVQGEKAVAEDKFSQAAIPAVLIALYKYVQSDKGAESFLRGNRPSDWTGEIFQDHKNEVVQAIADYASESFGDSMVPTLNQIANEAERIAKQQLSPGAGIEDVKTFFHNQRSDILLYLPPALNMGDLLGDDTLDDNTNKMEGPVSSLMQTIGAVFSTPVSGEKELH